MPISVTQLLAIVVELALMLVLPVVAAIWWCRRRRVPGSVPLIAAGFYLLNLAVNVPLVTLVYPRLGLPPLATLALTALTYGVCEETARWLSFRVGSLRRHRDGDGAIAAGIGHGGTEAIMFGLPYLLGTVALLAAPASLPPETIAQLQAASPWLYLGTGLDRLPAMAGHLVFALLIVLAYRKGARYLVLAMALHALLDFSMFAMSDYAPTAVFVVTWAAIGVVALLVAARLWRRMPASAV